MQEKCWSRSSVCSRGHPHGCVFVCGVIRGDASQCWNTIEPYKPPLGPHGFKSQSNSSNSELLTWQIPFHCCGLSVYQQQWLSWNIDPLQWKIQRANFMQFISHFPRLPSSVHLFSQPHLPSPASCEQWGLCELNTTGPSISLSSLTSPPGFFLHKSHHVCTLSCNCTS